LWTVRENVTISYRGAGYEIGRGEHFYGIWAVAAPQSQPLEWWPETPEGWSGAWSRFTAIETPGTIIPVTRRAGPLPAGSVSGGSLPAGPPPGRSAGLVVAAALLAAGVVCGIVGLFPSYLAGASLAQQPDQLVPHLIYLAAWSASAVLILLGGVRQRAGALLGVGTSAVTFGFFLADAGEVISGGAHLAGPGLVLGLVGWLACAAGSVVAFRVRSPGRLGRPHSDDMGPVVMLMLAALGTAAAFAPAWDRFTLHVASGATQTVTAGNAFANPAPVIAGDVAVMVAVVAVVAAAALWRPARLGAALLAGAIIPMVAQAISALIGVGEAAAPTQFGFSSAQAAASGLTISSGLTSAFWIYCAFLVALIASFAWMLIPPHRAGAQPPRQAPPGEASNAPAPGPVEATSILPPPPQGREAQNAVTVGPDVAAGIRPSAPVPSPGSAAAS
jgi:hypothetical protein